MSAATSLSEPGDNRAGSSVETVPSYVRARGQIRASFAAGAGVTEVANLYESGGLRLRFPRGPHGCEAVIVNTGGGIVGGDHAELSFSAAAATDLMVTTQSAEKIYRAQTQAAADDARIDVATGLGEGARFAWLPQETILFDRASLRRRLDVDMASDATLTLLESTVFGRLAMGEEHTHGAFRDRWRVARGGRLVFAEDVRIEGDLGARLDRPACGGGARAMATLLHVAPNAEDELDDIRVALADTACEWGASAFNGLLVVRLLSAAPQNVRAAVRTLLKTLLRRNVPRMWQ